MNIKHVTIKLYLDAVTKFFARRPHCMPDPCATNLCKWSPLIDKILKEHLRWQKMPKRRNPITKAMIKHWINKAKSEHQDSFISALADWMILGYYAGFRKSEWLQDNTVYIKNKKQFFKNIDGTVKAFTLPDLVFRGKRSTRINNSYHTKIKNPDSMLVTYRFQKNNDNGQQINYTRNIDDPSFCAVAAGTRIRARAQRLRVSSTEPIAVFGVKGKKTFIFNTEVKQEMRKCATEIYNLTDPVEIQRYSSHSVRVGACVTLHATGASDLTIQIRLRWKSLTFKDYLRQVQQIADDHNIAVNNVYQDNVV